MNSSVLRKPLLYAGLAGVVLLLLLAGSASLGAADPQNNPSSQTQNIAELIIEPMSGKIKAPITITGSGFSPGERVDIDMDIGGVVVRLGTRGQVSEANEFGAFQVTSMISTACEPGVVYAVVAKDGKGACASYPLVVLEEEKK